MLEETFCVYDNAFQAREGAFTRVGIGFNTINVCHSTSMVAFL